MDAPLPENAAIQASASDEVVLIADDIRINRALLRAQLESEGLSVREATNGLEALEVLQGERVDAVISDILMPVMDGFRLCHEIRKSGKSFAGVPFVLYTATYNSPSDRELATTVGADDYILKPAPVAAVLESVRKARRQAHMRVPPPADQQPSDTYVLQQYSAALVRKLEERNAELQQAIRTLRSASDELNDLNQHLEERVQQRTADLEAANKALDSFTHSVAHDLRAPLSHISLSAELLHERIGQELDTVGLQNLQVIIDASDRMGRLISDLLDYSRSGRAELRLDRVELDVVLDEALAAVKPEAGDLHVEWRREHLPAVRGDHAMLRQVLINLLSNALKYSRMRDPVRIETGCRMDKTDEAVIFVRDNGVGFDMSRAGELFILFRRLHSDQDFEGTGVGLASAHQVIARHGGRMWAESVVNQSATFYFSLPAIPT